MPLLIKSKTLAWRGVEAGFTGGAGGVGAGVAANGVAGNVVGTETSGGFAVGTLSGVVAGGGAKQHRDGEQPNDSGEELVHRALRMLAPLEPIER